MPLRQVIPLLAQTKHAQWLSLPSIAWRHFCKAADCGQCGTVELEDRIEVVAHTPTARDKINEIITHDNPQASFRICSLDEIIKKYKEWKVLIPRVTPFFAVKCCDNFSVLKLLAALGTGFDCASKLEIEKILALGVQKDRIIYAHTIKSMPYLQYATQMNVDLMTFDNQTELQKIKCVNPAARVVIRIRQNAKAGSNFGIKFGCEPMLEAPQLLEKAKRLCLNVVGVSFHVGWQCEDPSGYITALEDAHHVFKVASSMGYKFNLLDLGGGYPGKRCMPLEKYAKEINAALDKYFPDPSVRVISEPGTYFMDSAVVLACNIVSLKKISDNNQPTIMYYINDGIYSNLGMVLHAHQIKIPRPLKKNNKAKSYNSIVWGQACNSVDMVVKDVMLPQMNFGDWLFFNNVGAYGAQLQTNFNGFGYAKWYFFINKDNWLEFKDKKPFLENDFFQYCDKGNQ